MNVSTLPCGDATLGCVSETKHSDHAEDQDRPGWCAACRYAYPCPGTYRGDVNRTLWAWA